MVEVLGEEIFEEFFEQLAAVYTYTLNIMLYSNEEQLFYDQGDNSHQYQKTVPFLMDVLAHIIRHHDDLEDIQWVDENTQDYF